MPEESVAPRPPLVGRDGAYVVRDEPFVERLVDERATGSQLTHRQASGPGLASSLEVERIDELERAGYQSGSRRSVSVCRGRSVPKWR